MNKWQNLGSGGGTLDVCNWVSLIRWDMQSVTFEGETAVEERKAGLASCFVTVNMESMLLTAALLIVAVSGQSAPNSGSDDRCAKALQAAAKESRAASDGLAADSRYAETHNGSFSPSMTQDFLGWYDKARSGRPRDYPPLTATVLSSAEQAQRQSAVNEFLRFRTARFEREATDRLERTIAACPHRADELRAMMAGARHRE